MTHFCQNAQFHYISEEIEKFLKSDFFKFPVQITGFSDKLSQISVTAPENIKSLIQADKKRTAPNL